MGSIYYGNISICSKEGNLMFKKIYRSKKERKKIILFFIKNFKFDFNINITPIVVRMIILCERTKKLSKKERIKKNKIYKDYIKKRKDDRNIKSKPN